MVEVDLGEPIGELVGESIGEAVGVRWQPDAFAEEREQRLTRASVVRLTTRCRYCHRRVHPVCAVDVPHGVAHEKCWERRLRAGRPALWLIDRRGAPRRSRLAPELEDGAHSAMRDLAGLCPVISTLRERTLVFLAMATKQGIVPALLNEIPSRHIGKVRQVALDTLYRKRLSQLFDLQLRLAVETVKGRPSCEG
jgi:hypothetical protein